MLQNATNSQFYTLREIKQSSIDVRECNEHEIRMLFSASGRGVLDKKIGNVEKWEKRLILILIRKG